jgi:Fic family protein
LRARIRNVISESRDGLTCDEVEVLTGLKHQTASARIRELALLGVIQENGKRPTRSGRNAVIWRLA